MGPVTRRAKVACDTDMKDVLHHLISYISVTLCITIAAFGELVE